MKTGTNVVRDSGRSDPPRIIQSLRGLWDFAFLGDVDLAEVSIPALSYDRRIPVPSAFDAFPDWAGKRGAAVYRRNIEIPQGREGTLRFWGVSLWSRVYIDGLPVVENACGYAPFEVRIPASTTSKRELVVLVDNRFDFERVPMHEEYFDFYQYGGIIRDVSLHLNDAGEPRLRTVQISPLERYRDGEVRVKVFLDGLGQSKAEISMTVDDAGEDDRRACTGTEWTGGLRVPEPKIWSPETPHLHTVRVRLWNAKGKCVDEKVVRFGLRKIEARDGALWLNGDRLILRGVNRHEWHPHYGPSTPVLQMAIDLQLLREMGCNFVRGAHYPQSQEFLDLCDEMGFLVWEENLGWGQREKALTNEKFRRDHHRALRAMVEESFNHPSVIIWGFLNEGASDSAYARPIYEESAALLRELDQTRLISTATMFPFADGCYDLVDLISLNIYPGWYGCEGVEQPLQLIGEFMEKCFSHIDESGFSGKPVCISEIGAEGLYGWHDFHNDFFTEEYQASYLQTACGEALRHPRSSGVVIWQFCDVRTYGGGRALMRPRAFNNKGVVDEYRRPKAAFRAVRECFQAEIGF